MINSQHRYSFKKGLPRKFLHPPFFLIRYQKNGEGSYRVAVVVGKKVSKSSVVRHRVKRVFIESLQRALQEKDISYDFVFFLKRSILEKNQEEVYNELIKVFSKI